MTYLPFESPMESRPIRDVAYEQLKHAIITGQIPAGSRIVETVYAEQLHISRTPLREALRKLERDGPSGDVWRAFLGCLGYTPGETAKFQTIEGLTVTGVADRASWERAYQYLMPVQK